MKILCTICARGGSKGMPKKNIRELLGLPLIAHSLNQARTTKLFDTIAVSSDCEEILAVAKKYGADLLIPRPAELATDEAPKVPVIVHAVETAEKEKKVHYAIVVDLAVTSPLRTVEDIIDAVQLQKTTGCMNVISGTEAHASPYFSLVELDAGVVHISKPLPDPVLRRQDGPKCYELNGAVYVWKRKALRPDKKDVFYNDTHLYIMPRERSVDIDDELDFQMVKFLMQQKIDSELGKSICLKYC